MKGGDLGYVSEGKDSMLTEVRTEIEREKKVDRSILKRSDLVVNARRYAILLTLSTCRVDGLNLSRLRDGLKNTCGLRIQDSTLVYHLKILSRAGFVKSENVRVSEKITVPYYGITLTGLNSLDEFKSVYQNQQEVGRP